MSYRGHALGESYSSAEMQSVYSTAPAEWTTRHSLRESYPSAELQSMYSTAPAEWTTGHSLGESYSSAETQSVFLQPQSTGPIIIWSYDCLLNIIISCLKPYNCVQTNIKSLHIKNETIKCLALFIISYLPIPLLGQDMTQGQFLSGV